MFLDFERNGSDIMKVFVSWSGELSKKYASFLKNWLEQCIQSVEVFFSAEDIEKGETWHTKLSNELRDTNFGIVCLTSDNVNAPWIHFEAGALSKMLDSRVATFAINVNFSDIKGPLSTFQATKLEKDDIFQLLQSINNSQEKALSEEKLKASFEAFWPNFARHISETPETAKISKEEKKTQSKINSESIDEILQLLRTQSAIINDPRKILPMEYLEHIIRNTSHQDRGIDYLFNEIYDFSKYLFDRFSVEEWRIQLFDDFQTLVIRLTSDYPMWRRRFSNLFGKYRRERDLLYSSNITDET